MRLTLNLIIPVLSVVVWLEMSSPLRAEFVALEKSLADVAKKVAEKLTDQKVFVATRELSKTGAGWAVHQAAGVEFTMALRSLKIDAVRAAADTRVEKLDVPRTPFAARDLRFLKDTGRPILIGLEWTSAPKLKLKIVGFQTNPDKLLWSEQVDLPTTVLSQDKNTPPRNISVVQYARGQMDKQIGSGESSELADEALKLVESTRRGFYRWGRELGPQEPWLPGDILQLEKVEYKLGKVHRKLARQTVIVDEIKPDEVVVLQQNAFPKGRVVQRETWTFKGLIAGEVVAFRPWEWPEEALLPTQRPVRFVPAKLTGKGTTVDLLRLLDPPLDEIHGVWYFENKNLYSQREFAGRIQIPFDLPKSYIVRLKVQRVDGPEQFGLGIVVDGHPTMVSIDGSEMQVTGLNQLDGLPATENRTTNMKTYLPEGKQVEIEVRVEPGLVKVQIGDDTAIDWKGDAARLTLGAQYTVPKTDWLFLSATNTQFEISSLTLEPIAAP